MQTEELQQIVMSALEDLKARDVRVLDVRALTGITDIMIVASGTSTRHVNALVQEVVEQTGQYGIKPIGVEGEQYGEWVLVDLGDVVVHVMLPQVRDFYNLEKLWTMVPGSKVPSEIA